MSCLFRWGRATGKVKAVPLAEPADMTDTAVEIAATSTHNIAPLADRQMTVIVPAFATSDDGDGPSYCRFLFTERFACRLRHLQRVLTENHLSELRVLDGPDRWGPGDVADEMRFNLAELVLTDGVFWFADSPKHTDYHVNSDLVEIKALMDAFDAGEAQYLIGVSDGVLELVAEDEAQDALEAEPFDPNFTIATADSLAD